MSTNTYKKTVISFRATPIAQKQLNVLKNSWGTNRSQAIERAIERAYTALEAEKKEKQG